MADFPSTDPRLAILLGLAVGDALGAGTEFQSPQQIAARHGEVRGYVQGLNHGFAPGEFTDDTQMTLCALGAYWDARVRGEPLARSALQRFQDWIGSHPPDVGITTSAALRASREHGSAGGFVAWEQSGHQAAGNGALMRAAASAIAGRRGQRLRREAVRLASLTHPDPRSLGACWLLVAAIEAILGGAGPAEAWQSALADFDAAELGPYLELHLDGKAVRQIGERVPDARALLRGAVEHGLTGAWKSQSGYVVDTLEAAVAASLAPTYLDGILPIVARGDDSDTVAAIAGAVLGARGLLPPEDLIAGLRCRFLWPSWPPDLERGWPALAAFVPPFADTDLGERSDRLEWNGPLTGLPPLEYNEVADRVYAGRAPLFRDEVRDLRALGVTHVIDLREDIEWQPEGQFGRTAIAELGHLGMARLAVPIGDAHAPESADLDRSLDFMETALHLGGTVYVHCRAGRERTAAVVACWHARAQACSAREALIALQARRPLFRPLAPQMAAVEAWLGRASGSMD
jgi:ADP-ribosylglycohydrolase/protein-tyrosine phosphatase